MKELYIKDIDIKNNVTKVDRCSKFIEVNSEQIHYKDEGEGHPIIFLHGIAGSLFIWDKWSKRLKNHYRVIRPDLPAFGMSGNTQNNNFSTNYYINFVSSFAEALGLKQFFLAGHSTGGQIAYETAAHIPEKVKALVLVAPTGFSKINGSVLSATFRLAFNTFGKKHITWLTSRYLLKKHLKSMYHKPEMVTDELTNKFLDNILQAGNRQSFFNYFTKNGWENSLSISEITTPTLMLWGEKDKILPVSDASKFKALITSNRLITYPDAGHFPFDEVSDKSCIDLVSFLEEYT